MCFETAKKRSESLRELFTYDTTLAKPSKANAIARNHCILLPPKSIAHATNFFHRTSSMRPTA
jgi:hypothetical protein